jgi:hypothetical protein
VWISTTGTSKCGYLLHVTGLRLNNYYLLLKKSMTLFLPIYVNLTSNKQYPVAIWQPYMVVISMLKIICFPVHEQWVVFAWVSSKAERSRDLIVCFESKRRQIKPKIKQHRKQKRWATRTYQKPEHITGACKGRAVSSSHKTYAMILILT